MSQTRKKICFIIASPMTARAFLMNHFKTLSKYYDIHLVANFGKENDFYSPYVISTTHIAIVRRISVLQDARALYNLIRFLHSMKFDAVHSVTPKAGLIGMISAAVVRVPKRIHIFTGQVWYTKKGTSRFILKFIDSLIGKLTTNILVDGNSQRNFLINEKVITEKKSEVLGPGSISGVDYEKFIFNQLTKDQLSKQIGLDSDTVIFGFLGRLTKDKGLLDLAYAFRSVHNRHLNARLLIVGPDEENIEGAIKNLVGEHGIIFLGPTSEPFNVLQIFDVFCLPSHREGFGTSVIEASLLGLPIICSDTYGLMETIQDGITGLRHKTHCIKEIEEKMELLVDNPNYRKTLGNNGMQYVINNFSADRITSEWLSFYHRLFMKG